MDDLDTRYLESTLGFAIRIAQLRMIEDVVARLARVDLRPSEFSVLCLIADNPGCRASHVAEYLRIARPNFVPLLKGLEKRSLVLRRESETDRRIHQLFPTKAGERIVERAKFLVAEQEATMTARLGRRTRDAMLTSLHAIGRIDFDA